MLVRRSNFPTLNNRNWTPTRFSDWLDELMDETFSWNRGATGVFAPELNVYETDEAFEITVALPGMKKEDFDISYDNGVLTISGERKREHEENGRRYHRVESRFGKFRRSLPLPRDIIKEDEIEASYDNGILGLTIPKVKSTAGKKIEIS
ncbi:MAG: Hsp20/alpha crystallin family protein [Balneolaceae bacterium]|nr:Hsp20/alpha crystallin family protein [Balneolaceae bacterium]